MITELGHVALILALPVALIQSVAPLLGAHRVDSRLMALGPAAAQLQFAFVAAAFGALIHAYLVSDFSVLNVVQNSHSAKPLLYKITGAWGNHEGSMLLWVLILTLFGMLVGTFGRTIPPALKARVLSVQGIISVGFLLFTLLTSNPFQRVADAPIDGLGMNPLLQDPGIAFHPPFLYLGYVGFSVVFAFAVAALLEGRVDSAWARWARPWILLAWSALTLGIAMGSWWAYYELGWGGWWFWDPVENASFMPWLLGTALLHSALVVEKRNALKKSTLLLAILTFSLSLVGTFLVRSGVLTSVHAFAQDPARGVFILVLLIILIGGSLLLYARRAAALAPGGGFSPISREGSLLLNNVLLITACGTVFLGTLYPLFSDVVGGAKLSVGAPYFNATFVPIMVPAVIAMAMGPLLPWKRGDLGAVLRRLWIAFAVCAAVALGTILLRGDAPVSAVLGLAVAAWLLAATLVGFAERIGLGRGSFAESCRRAFMLPRAAYGGLLAHGGLAVVVAGITAVSAWESEAITMLKPGESTDLAGYRFTLEEVQEIRGPNYEAQIATIRVHRGEDLFTVLLPEKRWYPIEGQDTTEAAIHTTGFGDLYAAIGDSDGRGAWTLRIYHKPLVPWIWAGAVLIVIGGLVSATDKRLRVGLPRRQQPRHADASPRSVIEQPSSAQT